VLQSNEVVIDFETANPVLDLSEVGSTAYSKHPLTEILCLGVSDEGRSNYLWVPAGDSDRVLDRALNPRFVFIAHNVGFEKDIWRNIMVSYYGFPDIPNHRWHDTMAVAYLRGLPGSLEKLLIALGLPGKDMAGSKLTRSLSRFSKKGYLDRRPETLQRVYQYCMKDVADEVAVHSLLGYLPPEERAIWEIDQEINERGLMFDLPLVQGAQKIYQAVAPALAEEFKEITGLNPTQTGKFKDWLSSQSVELPNLRKETLAELLGDEDADPGRVRCDWEAPSDDTLPDDARRALTIRALIASSSVSKYARMEGCLDKNNGRICRLLQYHGAGTGRWAGRLLNPHNMPRGVARKPIAEWKVGPNGQLIPAPPDAELLAKAITSGKPAKINALGLVKDDRSTAHPIEILASALRNTVIPRAGNVFLIGDWSNIEARLDLSIAGQRDKIALMVAGHDVYLDMACVIYHVPAGTLTKADVEKRQTGKNTVLGCGFQMGWPKFQERYCPKDTPQFAKGVVDAYRKTWAPQVPLLWRGLQDAALSSVQRPGSVFGSHGIEYRIEGSWLVGHCPDGSCLYYYRPTLCRQKPRWKEITDDGGVIEVEGDWTEAWRYQVPPGKTNEQRVGASGSWVHAYGGLLTENYIQHMARQILCGALREAKRQGLPVVLHNQDELVLEVPEWLADNKILQQIMEQQPDWLKPYAIDPDGNSLNLIQAECFEPCTRYHK
jgi:DNA polymerase